MRCHHYVIIIAPIHHERLTPMDCTHNSHLSWPIVTLGMCIYVFLFEQTLETMAHRRWFFVFSFLSRTWMLRSRKLVGFELMCEFPPNHDNVGLRRRHTKGISSHFGRHHKNSTRGGVGVGFTAIVWHPILHFSTPSERAKAKTTTTWTFDGGLRRWDNEPTPQRSALIGRPGSIN